MISERNGCIICLILTSLLLLVILLPLSLSYIEYYEYGLAQRKSTGKVDTSRVYTRGRHAIGPDYKFLKYRADAHIVQLDNLSVFSAGLSDESIGLEFKIDVDFTFFLKRDEIGTLHRQLASSYESVIISRAKDGIKNEAIFITFDEYFQNRTDVELRFRDAVQSRWDVDPPLHCTLDQFHLGRIQIPSTVASKQLEAKVQNEKNDMESFLQQAQIEREITAVQANEIDLERDFVLRKVKAEAELVRAKARVEARRIVDEARVNGTVGLFFSAGIESQEERTAFDYIRALRSRGDLSLDVSYLDAESVLRTRGVP